MIKAKIIIPKHKIVEVHEPLDESGGEIATLDNGMHTDFYVDPFNTHWSITNDKNLIEYLNYRGLELESYKVTFREIYFIEKDGIKTIRFELSFVGFYENMKLKIAFNPKENFSNVEFLIFNEDSIDVKIFNHIVHIVNYFLEDIEGITNSSFTVDTNRTKIIDWLLELEYENKKGFINAYDNLNFGVFLLEKKLMPKN